MQYVVQTTPVRGPDGRFLGRIRVTYGPLGTVVKGVAPNDDQKAFTVGVSDDPNPLPDVITALKACADWLRARYVWVVRDGSATLLGTFPRQTWGSIPAEFRLFYSEKEARSQAEKFNRLEWSDGTPKFDCTAVRLS